MNTRSIHRAAERKPRKLAQKRVLPNQLFLGARHQGQ